MLGADVGGVSLTVGWGTLPAVDGDVAFTVGVSAGVPLEAGTPASREGDAPAIATAARFQSSAVGAESVTVTEGEVDGAVNRCAQYVSITRVSTLWLTSASPAPTWRGIAWSQSLPTA